MKPNKFLLSSQVRSKAMGMLTSAYVAEAFVNGLPFNAEEVANEQQQFTNYAISVVNKMHPETLLARAIESSSNSETVKYLKDLNHALEGVAEKVAARTMKDEEVDNASTPEVIDQLKLDQDEVEKFTEAAKHNGVDAVSEIVKKKMIDTIKAERQDYENSEKIRREIKDIIREENDDLKESLDEDDEEEETTGNLTEDGNDADNLPQEEFGEESVLESYYNIVLEPTDPRKHVSVFSKIQDICMEAILRTTESFDEVPFKTVEKITLEHTFPFFDLKARTLVEAVEAMALTTATEGEDSDEEEKQEKMKKVAKTAFISTITIMTMLEVLKTMGVASPTLNQVKDLVNGETNAAEDPNSPAKVEADVDAAANKLQKSVAMGAMGAEEAAAVREALMNARNILSNSSAMESDTETKQRIISKIDDALSITAEESFKDHPYDSYSTKLKDNNIVAMEYASKLLSRKFGATSVQFRVDSNLKTEDNKIAIEAVALDDKQQPVAKYEFDFNAAKFLGDTVVEAVLECATYADFSRSKPVELYYPNAGYSVPIK